MSHSFSIAIGSAYRSIGLSVDICADQLARDVSFSMADLAWTPVRTANELRALIGCLTVELSGLFGPVEDSEDFYTRIIKDRLLRLSDRGKLTVKRCLRRVDAGDAEEQVRIPKISEAVMDGNGQ
ncbi:hypothetical protein EDD85DRAFT_788669 [Armillaria nabsnona]|nr:hypothetical protein EDD85DRAFT_788669 [Armillaria nabsnona]